MKWEQLDYTFDGHEQPHWWRSCDLEGYPSWASFSICWQLGDKVWLLSMDLGDFDIDIATGTPEYLKAVAEMFVTFQSLRKADWRQETAPGSDKVTWYHDKGSPEFCISWDTRGQCWALEDTGMRYRMATAKTVEPLMLVVAMMRTISAMP